MDKTLMFEIQPSSFLLQFVLFFLKINAGGVGGREGGEGRGIDSHEVSDNCSDLTQHCSQSPALPEHLTVTTEL